MGVISTADGLIGRFNAQAKDMTTMLKWFGTGRFVADTTRQSKLFGPAPTPRQALADLLEDRAPTPERQPARLAGSRA